MNLKDFDFKKFFLEKGERIGLGVAALIALLLLTFNLFWPGKGVFSPSPSAIAGELREKTQSVNAKNNSNKPTPDELRELTYIDPRLQARGAIPQEDPDAYRIGRFFDVGGLAGNKRRNPRILAPDEFQVTFAHLLVRQYILHADPEDPDQQVIGMVKPIDQNKVRAQQQKNVADQLKRIGQQRGGGGRGGVNNARGRQPGVGLPGFGAQLNKDNKDLENPITFVRVNEMKEKGRQLVPAENRLPLTVAIIAGSFPVRDQMEEFQKALRLRSPQEATRFMQFSAVEVQRRSVSGSSGKTDGEWQTLDLTSPKSAYVQVMIHFARDSEPEDPLYRSLLVRGLVMKRPVPDASTPYPKIEEDLEHLKKTIEDLKKQTKRGVPEPGQNPLFDPEGYDPFGGEDRRSPNQRPRPGSRRPNRGGGQPPAHCLVRLLDVTVEPGVVYEYRLRIRARNPNHGKTQEVAWPALAEKEVLESAWVTVPQKVSIPPDLRYYAVDQKQLDPKDRTLYPSIYPPPGQTVVQLHRWLDDFNVNAQQAYPVGSWVIAPRVFVSRGEYLGRMYPVKLPVWDVTKGQFVLATKALSKKPGYGSVPRELYGTVEVPFGRDNDTPLLVDFEGGLLVHRRANNGKPNTDVKDEAPTELLLLSPDGKLLARNNRLDSTDTERDERYKAWKERVEEIDNREKGLDLLPPGAKPNPFRR